jgi:uncharacterized protein
MKSYFPDINVWLALAYRGHQHHPVAASWFGGLGTATVAFCRLTQLGFLRLLTYPAVMGDEVKTAPEAWKAYDQLLSDSHVGYSGEPDSELLDGQFRSLTAASRFAPQHWPDAYLAAFARAAHLTLVTFDRNLSRMAGEDALLLN